MLHQAIGGQLLKADLQNRDLFYLSPLLQKHKTARGGLPICFPQFATLGELKKHGFARDLPWQCRRATATELWYELHLEAGQQADWPHAALLTLEIHKHENRLSVKLEVTNTGTDTWAFTGGLHPYFNVENLHEVELLGLKGCSTQNKYQPNQKFQEVEVLSFGSGPFESAFEGNPVLWLNEKGQQRLKLTATGFSHWMVWNPGQEEARSMADLPEKDWQKFICIEPVLLSPVSLAAGSSFMGILEIELL